MTGNENHVLIVDGCADKSGTKTDPKMLRVRTLITQKNSGVQMVTAKLHRAYVLATCFKSSFREYAEELVMAREYGLASLSSEQAALLKELNTTRHTESITGINQAPPAGPLDRWLHGKKTFNNNPMGRDEQIVF